MFPWKHFSSWSAFFHPERQQAAQTLPPSLAPLPRVPQPPRLTTLEGRLLLLACHLPPDWRLAFAQELGRILAQRRRQGYLRLPPPRLPVSYERFGTVGQALRPLSVPAVCEHLRDEVWEIVRLLEAPAEAYCRTQRNCLLARRAARLGHLVDNLAQPRRGVDAWQELFQALLALPGAQGVDMPTRPRAPRHAKAS